MFKRFILRAALGSQLKGLPKAMQKQVLTAIEKNPKFFESISKEVKVRVKQGQDKMFATQAVMMEHRAELQKMLQG